ncbi:MAG TPA: helix-turn-helix domain-containing protein [Verrucomicrobiae bacterium]|nr:helix-turn-helix domain-containing protein [Verrucomicrobiae bacterium]
MGSSLVPLDILTGKWTVPVIYTLQQNTLRFSRIEKAIPDITQKSLTDTLRNLERNGMVDRYIYPTVPPQVEYKLTALGLELLELCETMNTWTEKHHEEIARAQRAYARRKKQRLLYLVHGTQEVHETRSRGTAKAD